MGKTTPSITQVIEDIKKEIRPLYEGLPATEQRRLDMLFKRASKHKVALANAKSLRPIIMLALLMVLEVHKLNNEMFNAQYQEMKRMRKALEAAGIFMEEKATIEEEANEVLEIFGQA